MSAYISEWIAGYEVFMSIGNTYWNPTIICKKESDEEGKVGATVSVFDPSLVSDLAQFLGHGTGDEFVSRFNGTNLAMMKFLHVEDFIEENLESIVKDSDGDLTKTSTVLTDMFNRKILDFEFYNFVDVVELYANLIFYGRLIYPKPVYFFVPPKNEWTSYPDGWAGYSPGYPDDEDEDDED